MPTVGIVHPLPPFSGLPILEISTGEPPSIILPRGFDAVAQCDQQLLHAQLVRNLSEAGLTTLSARIPYALEGLPPEVDQAVGAYITPGDLMGSLNETTLELRLVNARLRTVGRSAAPDPGGVTLTPLFAHDGAPAEIAWTLELNLVRIEREMVVGTRPDAPPLSPFGDVHVGDLVVAPDRPPPPPNPRESRTLLAAGEVVSRIPTRLASRPELLLAWLELDTARTATTATSDDPPLTALLQTPRGQDLLRTALSPLTSRGVLRLSPQIALAGFLAPQYVVDMGLSEMQVRHKVHVLPNGREVLSLAFTFGDDPGGPMSELQPFIGQRNFAFHVTRETLTTVIRTRWTLRPADHEFVGDTHVEMPLHEGTEQTGQGTVRVRVRLGAQLTDVGIMAALSPQGDVLRLGCDQEVQILAAWYANGDPVGDLGELGAPATFPFVINVAPFTPAPPSETVNTSFRNFLLTVLEPLAVPMVERFRIQTLDGFVSAALGSSTAWWSLPSPTPDVAPGLPSISIAPA